jgi:hypothetical protein
VEFEKKKEKEKKKKRVGTIFEFILLFRKIALMLRE